MSAKIPGGFKGFMLSEGSIALNPKTSMLYCLQAMMAGVVVSTGMVTGALSLILYVYIVLLAVYGILSPNYLLNNKIGGTTALAVIAEESGYTKIANFLNRWGFAFLLSDSVITMLITVTAAAATITYLVMGPTAESASLIHDIGNQSTWLTMVGFSFIVLAIRWIQPLGTNRLGAMMSWIALIWTIATIAISLPHFDISIFLGALNPMSALEFIMMHPFKAGAISLAFLAPTGLEMMYADISHIGVSNMRKTAGALAFWAIIIYTSQAGFIADFYGAQGVVASYSGMVSEMSRFFGNMIGGVGFAEGFAWFMSIMTVLASAAAVQSTNIGAQVLCQESSNSGNLFTVAYKYPQGCNAEQGYSPFVADTLTILGLSIGNVAMILMGSGHAAHLFDNMYGPVILLTMITTAYTFYLIEKKYQKSGKWSMLAQILLLVAIVVECILLLSSLVKISYDFMIVVGLATTLTLSITIAAILWMHTKFETIKGLKWLSVKDFFADLRDDMSATPSDDNFAVHLVDFHEKIPAFCVEHIRSDLNAGKNVQVWKIKHDSDMVEHDIQEIRHEVVHTEKNISLIHVTLPTTAIMHVPSLVEKFFGDTQNEGKISVDTAAYTYKLSDFSKVTTYQAIIARMMLFMRNKAFEGFQVDRKIPVYVGNHFNPYSQYTVIKA